MLLDIVEALGELEPVATYPARGAELVAKLLGANAYRIEVDAGSIDSRPPVAAAARSFSLRFGGQTLGVLHLERSEWADSDIALGEWAARVLARGLRYGARLSGASANRGVGEAVQNTLQRAPLTPRERDVVSLLISGASTRDIAGNTGLTVSTVNTYLKRIFSKLGVHSRVELIARMAGTDGMLLRQSRRPAESPANHD